MSCQGLRSSAISSQPSTRPPAPAPFKTKAAVQKDPQPSNGTMYDDVSDEESESLTETEESATTSATPEQLRRTTSQPVASPPSGIETTRSQPPVPQPYTSAPAQSGSSLAARAQAVMPASGHTIQSENALVTMVPSQPAGQKQETSWDR